MKKGSIWSKSKKWSSQICNSKKAYTLAKDGKAASRLCRLLPGFTLAEVLITLGIIGIVAALTIPTLVSKYQKHVVETRLKKFYSTMNEAIKLSEMENGDKKEWEFETDNNPYSEATLRKFYEEYFAKYLKNVRVEYNKVSDDGGLDIFFADGSVVQIEYGGKDYTYCINEKRLKKYKMEYGKECFMFGFYPTAINYKAEYRNKGIEPYVPHTWDHTREGLFICGGLCYTKLIQLNNWTIPEDYPIKF